MKYNYNPNEINISTNNPDIGTILGQVTSGKLTIPDDSVWDANTKSLFIESILIRIPLQPIYIDASSNKWAVIDGAQRLHTLHEFVVSESLTLCNLEYLHTAPYDANGMKYSEMSRKYQRRILETRITVQMITTGTPGPIRDNIISRLKSRPGSVHPKWWLTKPKPCQEPQPKGMRLAGKIQ